MFGLDLMAIGFFATLGGKGAIDTYDAGKKILTGVVNSEAMHKIHKKVDDKLGRHKDEHKEN